MSRYYWIIATTVAISLSACTQTNISSTQAHSRVEKTTTPAYIPATLSTAQEAIGILNSASGSLVSGKVVLVPIEGGVQITGAVGGLTPGGQFGFHVHEKGDCSAADATSAGGHFNPANTSHGRVIHTMHHGGDMDNIIANTEGVAYINNTLKGVTLGGKAPNDISDRGLIVHAQPDDYVTQPTGNAGARVACGVIRVVR